MAKRKKSKYPEIKKLYDSLLYAKTSWEVWEDIIQMYAISLSNCCVPELCDCYTEG